MTAPPESRVEYDILGAKEVQAGAYWGVQEP